MEVINYLLGYKDLKICQNTEMFNFSLDSVLLPNFVTLNKKITKILDIGTGNSVIPIILSTKIDINIDAVEIQKEVFELGKKSIEINNLQDRIKILNLDIKEYASSIETDTYDTITCNPPFFKVSSNSNLNDNDYKTIARHEVKLNIYELMSIAKKILKNNGNIAVVHRSDRLIDIIEAMKNNNIEPKKIQFVYPKKGLDSNILLIEGRKNGNPGIKILDPIYAHDDKGEYSEQIEKYFS